LRARELDHAPVARPIILSQQQEDDTLISMVYGS